jgi:hypothetical protein
LQATETVLKSFFFLVLDLRTSMPPERTVLAQVFRHFYKKIPVSPNEKLVEEEGIKHCSTRHYTLQYKIASLQMEVLIARWLLLQRFGGSNQASLSHRPMPGGLLIRIQEWRLI